MAPPSPRQADEAQLPPRKRRLVQVSSSPPPNERTDNDSDQLSDLYDEADLVEKDVDKVTERFRVMLEHQRPRVAEDELDIIIGPADVDFDLEWGQADEVAVQREWEQSDEKQALSSLTNANTPLWRDCLRLFLCSPLAILSPLNNLKYQPMHSRNSRSEVASTVFFSTQFAHSLVNIMRHPFWQCVPWRLIIALQYAVICRLDDRRPWKPDAVCPAFERLRTETRRIQDSLMPRSIHKMHKKARSQVIQSGLQPSDMSNFLVHLGKTIKQGKCKVPDADKRHKDIEIYPVNLHDLRALVKALDSYSSFGLRVEQYYDAFKAVKHRDDPPEPRQLREFYERAALHELRRLTKYKAKAALGSSGGSSPSPVRAVPSVAYSGSGSMQAEGNELNSLPLAEENGPSSSFIAETNRTGTSPSTSDPFSIPHVASPFPEITSVLVVDPEPSEAASSALPEIVNRALLVELEAQWARRQRQMQSQFEFELDERLERLESRHRHEMEELRRENRQIKADCNAMRARLRAVEGQLEYQVEETTASPPGTPGDGSSADVDAHVEYMREAFEEGDGIFIPSSDSDLDSDVGSDCEAASQ